MSYRKVKVLIVDDSLFFRNALQKALDSDTHIEVIGSVCNSREAEKILKEIKPDVITLDVEMPGMKGTDFIKKILPIYPIPVVLVSALNMSVFEALQSGAIDFVKKPDMTKNNDFNSFANEISVKVKIASTATIKNTPLVQTPANVATAMATIAHGCAQSRLIVAIGASTGGTEATLEVLKILPAEFPPIVITQHMPAGFTKMYADRLNRICPMRVEEATNGMRCEQGLAIIAAGDKQMTLERDGRGYYVRCAEGEKVSGHCPSVDVLFTSVEKSAGSNAIGVILTGMGRDGANGLLSMKKKGCYTIGQCKESCIVYGMPMEAKKIGAVDIEAPVENIAGMLVRKVNSLGK